MTISSSSVAAAIERFIRVEFHVSERDTTFTRDVHLFDSGFVDSVGLAQLITFLESTFEVVIDDEMLMSDDFTTIDGMSRLVACAVVRCRA